MVIHIKRNNYFNGTVERERECVCLESEMHSEVIIDRYG